MTSGSSDFAERLKAMRAGKQAQSSPQTPSLKDRLNREQPNESSSQKDVRESIRAKFKAQAEAKKSQSSLGTTAIPDPKSALADENLPELELAALPEQQKQKEEKTQQWSPENGGICPSCNSFNPPHVAFCGHCRYMLLRSEEEIEIITSYPLLEMKGLVHTFIQNLAKLKITSTEEILRAGLSHRNRQMLVKHSGMSERSLMRLIHQANICRVPSMGPENTALLELIGINTLEELLTHKPLELYKKIQQSKIKLNQSGIMFLPTKSQTKLWLEEAAALSPIKFG